MKCICFFAGCLFLFCSCNDNPSNGNSFSVVLLSDSTVYHSVNDTASVTFTAFNATNKTIYFLRLQNQRYYVFGEWYISMSGDSTFIAIAYVTSKGYVVNLQDIQPPGFTLDSLAGFASLYDTIKMGKGVKIVSFLYSFNSLGVGSLTPRATCSIEIK